MKNLKIIEIQGFKKKSKIKFSLYLTKISAGFPSPAQDYVEKKLDLNEHLIKHPAATFFLKVEGNSMINAGIFSGDILVVDRSLEVRKEKIVVAMVNGEFTVKRIRKQGKRLFLIPENSEFKPIEVKEEDDFEIWGVVIHAIHFF